MEVENLDSKLPNTNTAEWGIQESHTIHVNEVVASEMPDCYTGEYVANCSLEEFQQKYMCGNSPVMSYINTPNGSRLASRAGSRNNSDSEDNEESIKRIMSLAKSKSKSDYVPLLSLPTPPQQKDAPSIDDAISYSVGRPKFEKLTYADVEKSLSKYYNVGDNSSGELDLLTTWISGLIAILKYSQNLNLAKLWAIMLFSASISTSISFIVPFTHHDQFWNLVYICGSSALNAIMAIIILWSKFDYHAKSFETVVTQYDYVRTMLDPATIGANDQNMMIVRGEMELQVTSIQSRFPHMIPAEVANMYPLLSHTNIFVVIKKIELYRKNLIIKLKDIKNEIRYIIYKWSLHGMVENIASGDDAKLTNKQLKERRRFMYLLQAKEETKDELKQMRNTYSQLNDLFIEEMKYANSHKIFYTLSSFIYKKPSTETTNPVLKDYLRLIQ